MDEVAGQELSRKKESEVGFQYRSPGFPIRLLFSEPVSLYTRTRVCTHTCTEQHSAESESRSGHFPLSRGAWERRQQSRVSGGVCSVPCTGG